MRGTLLKSQSWEELFSKYFVNVNVILKLKKEMCIPWTSYQRKTLFLVDISVDWAAGRRWQTKLLDTWKVTQIHYFPRKVLTEFDCDSLGIIAWILSWIGDELYWLKWWRKLGTEVFKHYCEIFTNYLRCYESPPFGARKQNIWWVKARKLVCN